MQPSFIRNHLVFKTWLLIVYVYCMCFNTWRMQDTSSDNIALLLNSEIACRFYTSVGQITNNYWTKYYDLSVASRSIIRLRQIIDLQDYIAITEFNNIVLSLDHWVCFLMNIHGKWSVPPLSCKVNRKKEKSSVSF